MFRKLAVIVAAVVAFALTAQSANADWLHQKGDPRVKAAEVGVGAAATAGFFAINKWNWKWDTANTGGMGVGTAMALTTVGCMAASPIVATILTNRPLTYREAHVLAASCLIPIVGGWLVNAAYDAHPEWEPGYKPPHKAWHKHAKK